LPTLHPPPLVELLGCCFDQLPGALHQLIKHDVKLLAAKCLTGPELVKVGYWLL
jgi:hypothetical protein